MSRPDPDAEFDDLVVALAPGLHRTAVLLTGDPHAAEDLVQSALAKVYAAWWRVRRADDRAAYVHGVLRKTFLSERRRRSSTELPVAAVGDRPAAPAGDADDRLVLVTALQTLAPLDRAVVVSRFWEDRSVADTAHDLGLTHAAVKNRSLRALRSLRVLLGDPPPPSPAPPTSPTLATHRRLP